MSEVIFISVLPEHAGWRCEQRLADALDGFSRRDAVELLKRGRVVLEDGASEQRARKGERLVPGQRLRLAGGDLEVQPDPTLALDVVFESPDIVVVNKAAGVPSVPIGIMERGTLANACVARYPEMRGVGYRRREPGLCHRLDTHTSGLLVAARNQLTFRRLEQALRRGELEKSYLAICHDAGLADVGVIDRALQHRAKAVEVVASEAGNPTRFQVLKRFRGLALVQAQAAAAFRHQVRAHLAWLGAPLLGDTTYGAPAHDLGHHALHASRLSFRPPEAQLRFDCEAPLPPHLARLVDDA